jgi:hypothetical protein
VKQRILLKLAMTQHQFLYTLFPHNLFILQLLCQFLGPETQAATYFPLPVTAPPIKIGHDAAPIFTSGVLPIIHTFSAHIYLFYIYFFSFGALHPIFSFTSHGRDQGAKPLGPNSNFTAGAFAHCNTHF